MTDIKDIEQPKEGRQRRRDLGGTHYAGTWGGCIIRQYLLNGKFVAEFSSIREAVDANIANGNNVRYNGIWACLQGTSRNHAGFLWRSDLGVGRGKLIINKEEQK